MHPTSTRRRVAALAVAAATTMTVLTVTTPAQGQAVGTLRTGENYRFGNPPASRARDIPGLAVNPADPRHIVQVEKDILSQDCSTNVSTDGGVTWVGGSLVPPGGFPPPGSPVTAPSCPSFEGSVVWGTGQSVFVTFAVARAGQGNSVIVSKSSDGGRTFAPTVAMNTAGSSPSYIRPEVGIHRGGGTGGADRVYVSAQATVGGFARVWVAVSNDGGTTWGAPVDVSGGPATNISRQEPGAPKVMKDGSVAVAYRVPDPNPPGGPTAVTGTIQVARSTNGGVTWTQVNVTPVLGYVDEAGSRFNGSNFPRMSSDPNNNNLYLVYMEGPPVGGRQDHFIHPDVDVMFTRSLDGGLTWSAPKRINDDPPGKGAPATGPAQRHPKVSVASNGRVDVVWQDRRHGYRSPTHSHLGNGEARMGDTYITYSSDAGATFAPNRRVSDKSQNLDVGYDHYGQEYWAWGPALVELGNDEILFAWMDSREGNFENENVDIYLARTSVRATETIPVQRLPEAAPTGLSVALSRYAYMGGPEAVLNVGFTNRPFTRPVIVNSGDAQGALAAAVLSRAHLGPVLAAPAGGLTAELKAEVRRMSPIGAFVIGGESVLAPAVVDDLAGAGVPRAEITRYAGSPSDVARSIAVGLDRRSDAQKSAGTPAFDAVVVVNPSSPEAYASAGMASALRLPVLFTERDSVPAATRQALSALNITTTLVVGGTGTVSESVRASLPGAKRLDGADVAAVSRSVVAESVARGLPANIVYVTDAAQPLDAALVGAAIGRVTGVQLLVPGADTAAADQAITALGMKSKVDRFVVARSRPAESGPGYRLVARAVSYTHLTLPTTERV